MGCSIIAVSGMAFEARIARGLNIHTVYGLAPSRPIQDIEQAIQNGAKGILSFGTAAGLSPALAAGAIIIAKQVKWQQQTYTTDSTWSSALQRQLPDALCADMAGVDSPLVSAQEKSQLYESTGAVAADMESHHVAQMARRYNLPFAVLRVVLDDVRCALPPAALAAITPEGETDYIGLLVSLIKHPQQLPMLLRLSADHAEAKKSLLRCGNLKGNLFGFDSLR